MRRSKSPSLPSISQPYSGMSQTPPSNQPNQYNNSSTPIHQQIPPQQQQAQQQQQPQQLSQQQNIPALYSMATLPHPNRNGMSTPNVPSKVEDSLAWLIDPTQDLLEHEKTFAFQIAGMGFPLPCVARTIQRVGVDQKEVDILFDGFKGDTN